MKNGEFVDDVLRKVGRSLDLFQQSEQLLKFEVANGNLPGFASELKTLKEAQENKVNKQTMGTLVGQYVENLTPESDTQPTEPEVIDEAYFSFSFRIECDDDYYASRKVALAKLVSERNDHIHHLLPRFDMKSAESCRALGKELDEQSDKIRLVKKPTINS